MKTLTIQEAEALFNWADRQAQTERQKEGRAVFCLTLSPPDAIVEEEILLEISVCGFERRIKFLDLAACPCGCKSHDHL